MRLVATTAVAIVLPFSLLGVAGWVGYQKQAQLPVDPISAEAQQFFRSANAMPVSGSLASPWGRASTRKDKNAMVLDVEAVPRSTCISLLAYADQLGSVRAASASLDGRDERRVPIAESRARQTCRQSVNLMRFVLSVEAMSELPE